jgi:hypothetical protein
MPPVERPNPPNESLKRTAADQFAFVSSWYSGNFGLGKAAGVTAAVVYFRRWAAGGGAGGRKKVLPRGNTFLNG